MRRDHEEQLQHLKLLKDREINAVTSATSHTRCVRLPGPAFLRLVLDPQAKVTPSSPRSLNGIIEQMEKFSSNLHELHSRVEASHLATTQERELGARQRDGQLRGSPAVCPPPLPSRLSASSQWEGGRAVSACGLPPVLQERLGQQQRDLEEERSRLQEVTAKMEARLGEQSRLLEQVWLVLLPAASLPQGTLGWQPCPSSHLSSRPFLCPSAAPPTFLLGLKSVFRSP